MEKVRREDINVRNTILTMKEGEVVRFPPVVKPSYVRNTCSVLKTDENIHCTVNLEDGFTKVTRIK